MLNKNEIGAGLIEYANNAVKNGRMDTMRYIENEIKDSGDSELYNNFTSKVVGANMGSGIIDYAKRAILAGRADIAKFIAEIIKETEDLELIAKFKSEVMPNVKAEPELVR